jgi:hypothetical protein
MKRATIAVLLLFFVATLAAQTALFGMSCGQSFSDLDTMLKNKGFTEVQTDPAI